MRGSDKIDRLIYIDGGRVFRGGVGLDVFLR